MRPPPTGISYKMENLRRLTYILLLYSFTLSPVISVDPIVTIKQPEDKFGDRTITALKNDDVAMVCVVMNKDSNTPVKWSRIDGKVRHDVGTDTSSSNTQKYIIVQVTAVSWRLTIQNIQESDKGQYVCKVQIDEKQYSSDFRFVRVVEKPQILDMRTSSDTSIDYGEKLTLSCNAQGMPPPKVIWSRMAGADLPDGGMERWNTLLPINKITPKDRGKYICQAVNEAGVDKRVISVLVRFPPQINPEKSRVAQALGYRTELVCFIEAFPDVTKELITWTRIGTPIDRDSDRYKIVFISGAFNRVTSKLIIKGVQSVDYGNYVCKATNTKGSNERQISLEKSSEPIRDRTGSLTSSASSLGTSSFFLFSYFIQRHLMNR
ncbi:protein amalgam [Octopus bimaculoides]|uniref:Ig-like domain-containing protein n=1 Tax=Octopus bimaculoides TaxID=37653 RepID=A0A0L8HNB6_OCTBM|nr:protein amalgam [Octopus bimaculoides]|eukprot:XP_014771262.1 PREDICTED: protein amalgam-like [Octopus bimaculoides]